MREPGKPAKGAEVVRVHVPFAIRKRGGRKLVLVPGEAEIVPERVRVDSAMIKALARAFRWRKLLETGVYSTIEEVATVEKINASYVGRLLRVTLLAPKIIEAILDGRHPTGMTLSSLMNPFPAAWEAQYDSLLRDATLLSGVTVSSFSGQSAGR